MPAVHIERTLRIAELKNPCGTGDWTRMSVRNIEPKVPHTMHDLVSEINCARQRQILTIL